MMGATRGRRTRHERRKFILNQLCTHTTQHTHTHTHTHTYIYDDVQIDIPWIRKIAAHAEES